MFRSFIDKMLDKVTCCYMEKKEEALNAAEKQEDKCLGKSIYCRFLEQETKIQILILIHFLL